MHLPNVLESSAPFASEAAETKPAAGVVEPLELVYGSDGSEDYAVLQAIDPGLV